MALSAADLAKLGGKPIGIQSTFFHNVFLRLDGAGVGTATDNGGGKVNCQYGPGLLTAFKVHANAGGSFSFESAGLVTPRAGSRRGRAHRSALIGHGRQVTPSGGWPM